MNGQFYLIKKVGTKYKFYWAPLSPWPEKKFEDWGVAVFDTSWITEDPRPKHLRSTPLGYDLKPVYQVLRDPIIDGKRDKKWRYLCLKNFGYLIKLDKNHRYASWACG